MTFLRYTLLLLLIYVTPDTTASRLDIKAGGFEGFVVAVNRDVPYSQAFIQHLQDLILDTSNILFDTFGLHMRSVNILVPSTWQREVTWEKTSKLTFDEADMRVDKPHPFYRNQPYTHPTWQCGEMQKYIHVTPDFVSDTRNVFKNKGTVLANQFGTYRYGVFDDTVSGIKSESATMSKTQERVCGGRTAWEVVKGHGDQLHSGQPRVDTVVTVVYNENDQIVQQAEKDCGRPVVLLLDFSASMDEHNRLLRQEQVGSKFIREILPLKSQVGVIAFSSFSAPLVNILQTLTSEEDKTQLIGRLSRETLTTDIGYTTGIGAALLHALRMLKKGGQPLEESRILLLTDGMENEEPKIPAVMSELVESKVKVHSIAVGSEAEESLGLLSTKTGGQLGQYLEGEGSATFNQVVNNLWSDFNMQCVEAKPIEVETRTFKLDKDHKEIEETVAIDSALKDTDFTFTPETDNIKVKLSAPDQTTYDEQSPEYRREQFNVIRFTIKDIQPGEWKIGITNMDVAASGKDGAEQVIMNVKAKGKDDMKTYEVRSWVSSVIVKIPAVTQIYAEVTKDYSPLIKAKVTAAVGTQDGTIMLDLMDDGKPPDIRYDGIYTGEFVIPTQTEKTTSGSGGARNERYSVDITVTPVEGETQLVQELLQQGEGQGDTEHPPSLYDREIRDEDIVAEPVVEVFKRKGTPGAFEVKDIHPWEDMYPPSRVEDLTITIEGEGIARLEWTAPGNDWRHGTALEYEIRLWHNGTELRDDLSVGVLLSPDMLVSGSLTPSVSGSQEVIWFHLPETLENHLVFVAMVSRDEAAHQSKVSVIAIAVPTEPVFNVMEDPASLFLYIYAAVFFITRLVEMTQLRDFFT